MSFLERRIRAGTRIICKGREMTWPLNNDVEDVKRVAYDEWHCNPTGNGLSMGGSERSRVSKPLNEAEDVCTTSAGILTTET
jgi:hypothetical protein